MTGPLLLALARRAHAIRIVACSPDAPDRRGLSYPGIPDSFFLPDGRVGAVPPEKVEAWRRENLPPWMADGSPLQQELAPIAPPSPEADAEARVAALVAAGLTEADARRVLRREPLLAKMAPATLVARLDALGAALPRSVVAKVARSEPQP